MTVAGPSQTDLHRNLRNYCQKPAKGPCGASRGLQSGHTIPIGFGAVGAPRSGIVLHNCIRKADEAGMRPRSVTALRIQDSADDALILETAHPMPYSQGPQRGKAGCHPSVDAGERIGRHGQIHH
jgi:hypothetical protein